MSKVLGSQLPGPSIDRVLGRFQVDTMQHPVRLDGVDLSSGAKKLIDPLR